MYGIINQYINMLMWGFNFGLLFKKYVMKIVDGDVLLYIYVFFNCILINFDQRFLIKCVQILIM